MKQTYARVILVLATAVLALLLDPAPGIAGDTCDGAATMITIEVAPAIINLQHYGIWLTIHTDIDYDQVKSAAVYFNWDEDTKEEDAFRCWKKADDRGFYVAKCDIRDFGLLGGEIGTMNTFTLKGETQQGEAFCGEQKVMIIDRGPEHSAPGNDGR
jgi:hypothetical protein